MDTGPVSNTSFAFAEGGMQQPNWTTLGSITLAGSDVGEGPFMRRMSREDGTALMIPGLPTSLARSANPIRFLNSQPTTSNAVAGPSRLPDMEKQKQQDQQQQSSRLAVDRALASEKALAFLLAQPKVRACLANIDGKVK